MFLVKFLSLFITVAVFHEPALAIKKPYVVYLGAHSHGPEPTSADLHLVTTKHTQLLSSSLGSEEKAKDALVYSYERHINGFTAFLEEEEAAEIAKREGVVSVFLNEGRKQLHTTRSWEFLMLENNNGVIDSSSLWKKARFGEDTIIANIDTGVWPESKSFSGEGYGPIPSRWKGICEFNESAGPVCNRKLIGARYFIKGYESYAGKQDPSMYNPRDMVGHGSHTLSTAAGNMVEGASVFGSGNGTAKGGAPRARVANYKICWPPVDGDHQCFDSDILVAFDAAIADGVDVISFSVGGDPSDYLVDAIAIGTFHAVTNGIPVIASGGNNGSAPATVSNIAPWIFTVAASTIDRTFEADVLLQNGSFFEGRSLSKALPKDGFYPLISAADAAAANASIHDALLCMENTLDAEKVKDKIVVCLRGTNGRVMKGAEAARAGASGMILCNSISDTSLNEDPHLLPAAHINYTDGLILFAYLNSTKNPQGLITPPKGVIGVKPSPTMADFSSRGPNKITPEILKPDITAPGVEIIAAYTGATSPTGLPQDDRTTPYYIISGTSMSCPHVAGVVGLLRTLHPDWTPAALKSAIMTTARTRDNAGQPMRDYDTTTEADAFARGAGHLRPNKAADPGLVYDMGPADYYKFLCGIGYDDYWIGLMSGKQYYSCPRNFSVLDLNYPSIAVPRVNVTETVTRTLKNVGSPGRYVCRVKQPHYFRVSVEPRVLKFEKMGEEKSFKVTITATAKAKGSSRGYSFGGLTWTDGIHYVRSPIVVANA